MSATSVLISSVVEPLQHVADTRYRPWRSVLTVLSLDLGGLTLSFGASILTSTVLHGRFVPPSPLDCLIAVVIFLGIFAMADLYRTVGVAPVEELRRTVSAICGTFLLLVFITFLLKESVNYSRGMILLAWCWACIVIPSARLIGKPVLGKRSWFAKPVAILGAGETARKLIETLKRTPGLALRPVVAFDDDPAKYRTLVDVPVVGGLDAASS